MTRTRKLMVAVGFVLIVPSALILRECVGTGGRCLPLTADLMPHPAVDWIFDAGDETNLAWHLFPERMPVGIHAAGTTDDQLILVSNLQSAAEIKHRAHAYVLDVETGTILKSMRGPFGTSWYDWLMTPDLVYFRVREEEPWLGFDVRAGRLTRHPPPPGGNRLSKPLPLNRKLVEQTGVYLWRTRGSLGGNRNLYASVRQEHETLELTWVDQRGAEQTRPLCHLPRRAAGEAVVVIDDARRLVFTWDAFAICVDKQRLGLVEAAAQSTSAPAE
ncbi:MAG: hypothetical protein ACYSVY_08145 [Planctomycetota bacterium]|jgi:hypothetical protein